MLREGAASQYGSDAIAGVINIVLKDNTDGLSASTYLGRTSRGDGLRLLTSANAGVPLGGGFLNVTMEMSRQEVTNRAGVAPTCFGPDPGYGPCANGGKVIQLMRNGEPDYKGAGFMANLALPVGESAEFYAFGGYSVADAVSDGLYRKADWIPRNVSYVHPDGFFPIEESELSDRSAVMGLRGDLGDWPFWHDTLALRLRYWHQCRVEQGILPELGAYHGMIAAPWGLGPSPSGSETRLSRW